MSLPHRPAGWRQSLLFWSPGVVAFVYVLAISDRDPGFGSLLTTVLGAVLFGVFVPVIGMFAYAIIFVSLGYLAGKDNPADTPFESFHSMIAGVLLAIAVWMWWQSDKHKTIDSIATCLDDHRYELETSSPGQLVRWCYDVPADNDDYDWVDW